MQKGSITVISRSDIFESVLQILEKSGALLEIQEGEIKTPTVLLTEKTSQIPGSLGVYSTIYPCTSYFPFIETHHPEMDVVLVTPAKKTSYKEYRQSPDICSFTHAVSKKESEKIIHTAFSYAQAHGRKKVTCLTKKSSHALTDSLFYDAFCEVSHEYEGILHESLDIDEGVSLLAKTPEIFDVIVAPRVYCNLLFDICEELTGASNFSYSIHIGDQGAAITPVLAPNFSNYLLSSIEALAILGQIDPATTCHNAWLKTLEEATPSKELLLKNLGKKPSTLQPPTYCIATPKPKEKLPSPPVRHLIGLDIFIYCDQPLEQFLASIVHINVGPFRLKHILNKEIPVWPNEDLSKNPSEQWCCRFLTDGGVTGSLHDAIQVLHAFDHMQMDVIRFEGLYTFDGKPGYLCLEQKQLPHLFGI